MKHEPKNEKRFPFCLTTLSVIVNAIVSHLHRKIFRIRAFFQHHDGQTQRKKNRDRL